MTANHERLTDKPDLDVAVFQRAPKKLQTELDGEIVILDMETNKYIGLNELGTLIWNAIEEPKSFTTLCSMILREYEVEEERCTQDLLKFMQDMIKNGLVTTND